MNLNRSIKSSIKAFAIHFALSCIVALVVASVIFWGLYPYPYRSLTGGVELFLILISVDLICGPLLTGIVFNSNKSKRELRFDLSVIVLLQVAALVYGLFSIWQSRPVYLAFEVDRFRVVTYADIKREDLDTAKSPLHRLPLMGVYVIGTRESVGAEVLESLDLSFKGYDPSVRPNWWVPYGDVVTVVRERASPVSKLLEKNPKDKQRIQENLRKMNLPEETTLWLPMTSTKVLDWVVFLDGESMKPVLFMHADGF